MLRAERALRVRVSIPCVDSRIEPCLPSPAKEPPSGPAGFTRLSTTASASWRGGTLTASGSSRGTDTISPPASPIVAALENLSVQSCFIDGEAIVVDRNGLSVFDLIRYRQHDDAALLCAFDLIELDGEDLRRSPFEHRKRALAELLRQKTDGIILNAHYEGDGAAVFMHACLLGCEGIVSKRLGSPYRLAESTIGSRSRTRRRRP